MCLPGGLLSSTASHTLIFRMKARSNCSTWDSRDSELLRRQQSLLAQSKVLGPGAASRTPLQRQVLDVMGKQQWKLYLMERRGGWVISKTNLSTGWCSLSRITTTTFSTSFCKNKDRKNPSLKQAVFCPQRASHMSDKVGVCLFVVAHSTNSYPKLKHCQIIITNQKKMLLQSHF